jgi:phosphoserine phosphatase
MIYQPMVELLAYLRANGFKTFIVSGGGIEFMRPWVEKAYGISTAFRVGEVSCRWPRILPWKRRRSKS